jgi:hypothetical protein
MKREMELRLTGAARWVKEALAAEFAQEGGGRNAAAMLMIS